MEIKFKIIGHKDGTYDIESTDIRYAYRNGCHYEGLSADEVIEAMKKISELLYNEYIIAMFYVQ